MTIVEAKSTIWTLALIYGVAALQIVAGFIGIILAGNVKAAKVCQVFGLISNTISLIVPVYYYYGAPLNKRPA